jgi:DNA-directed RNA polymerase specialized sigma24 family protein
MDDTALQTFFRQPTHVYHRQYEALRAIVVDGKSQKDVAEAFGFQASSLRQLMYEFRKTLKVDRPSTESPFFKPSRDAASV